MSLFEVHAVTCKTIRTTKIYWKYVIEVKHPESFRSVGAERAAELAIETLRIPDIMIRDALDPSVYRYYKRINAYFICVIAKHLNGDGYIITAYKTDRVKRGEVVWQR